MNKITILKDAFDKLDIPYQQIPSDSKHHIVIHIKVNETQTHPVRFVFDNKGDLLNIVSNI